MKITNEVQAVLDKQLSWVEEDRAVINGQLDRKLYVAVNKVLEAMGGKWNRSAKCHIFDSEARASVEEASLLGEYTDWKKVNQFFETPADLVDEMIYLSNISASSQVLEPSAGKGAIVGRVKKVTHRVTAVEIHPEYIAELCKVCHDIIEGDFLELPNMWNDPARFDVVIMNPPFRNQQDMRHVREAWKYVKVGGRLVSVMSPAWQYRSTACAVSFRKWVEEVNAAWRPNPDGTFASAGTNVSTGLLTATKEGDE